MLKYQLPEFYSHLLPEWILHFNISESKATCHSCNAKTYDKKLKCCTFEPFLPNYLLGAILQSNLPGKKSLQEKIKEGLYTLPLGAVAPLDFQVEFNQNKDFDFGKKADWLCRYFNSGENNCGIWRYRGSVCTGFYCQSDYENWGQQFWHELTNYLSFVEMALAQEVLIHMDFSQRQIDDMLQFVNIKQQPQSVIQQLWQDRYTQQTEFYIQCFAFVQKQTRQEFVELLGEQGKQFEGQLISIAQNIKVQ